MDSTNQNEKKPKKETTKQSEQIPPIVSKWTHDNARSIGLPIENRLQSTGKPPAEIFKLERTFLLHSQALALPEHLQPFIENVPSLEDSDSFNQFVSLKAKLRERVQHELEDFKTTGRKVSPEFHLMDALDFIFTADEEALYRSRLESYTRETCREEFQRNSELATSHLATVLIHLMDLPPGVFVYRYALFSNLYFDRPYQFKTLLDNGSYFSATPDGTLFYCHKPVAFFDQKKPSARSFGEALTIALENHKNGFSPQVLPQMRLHRNMLSFSLYYFTPDYLTAIQTTIATKETNGAHAYHLVWKGKQYLNLCVESERILALQCLMAVSKYLQNPTPDAFPLFENLVNKDK